MTLFSWLCGRCCDGPREMSDDVSQVKVRLTKHGEFAVVGSTTPGFWSLPPLTFKVSQSATGHSADIWDPVALSRLHTHPSALDSVF